MRCVDARTLKARGALGRGTGTEADMPSTVMSPTRPHTAPRPGRSLRTWHAGRMSPTTRPGPEGADASPRGVPARAASADELALQRKALSVLTALPREVAALGRAFEEAGHELALVGGPVRDAFLGVHPHDLDFATSAHPDETERLLTAWGTATWDMGREFGTIGARRGDTVVEVTTYRTDEYDPASRKPVVQFGDTLEGDLSRRDFTVNAMAVRLPGLEFVDPFDGLGALAEKSLRTPVTATQSFDDDPLRIMRAARFTAQLGFSVEEDVLAAMTELAPRLEIVSAERVRAELERLLLSPHARDGLDLMVWSGVADVVLPELATLRQTVDEHGRHKDVYEHTLTVLDQAIDLEGPPAGTPEGDAHPVASPDLVLRLAAIMHDIGKPATRRFEGPKVTFYHHDIVGAKQATKRLKALTYPTQVVKAVAKLIELHLRFHGYSDGEWTDAAVRRYVRDAGAELEHLHMLTRADCTTRNRQRATKLRRAYEELEWRIDELAAQEELASLRPHLDGTQIMEVLGIGPGRDVGQAYSFLLEHRTEHGPIPHDDAVELLRQWWADRGGQ